MIIQLFISFV